jgi:hypothetical protein
MKIAIRSLLAAASLLAGVVHATNYNNPVIDCAKVSISGLNAGLCVYESRVISLCPSLDASVVIDQGLSVHYIVNGLPVAANGCAEVTIGPYPATGENTVPVNLTVQLKDSDGNVVASCSPSPSPEVKITVCEPPEWVTLPENLTVACPYDFDPANLGFAATAETGCGGQTTVRLNPATYPRRTICGCETITVEYEFSGVCGSPITHQQTINVVDTTPPAVAWVYQDQAKMPLEVKAQDDGYAKAAPSPQDLILFCDECGPVTASSKLEDINGPVEEDGRLAIGDYTAVVSATNSCGLVTSAEVQFSVVCGGCQSCSSGPGTSDTASSGGDPSKLGTFSIGKNTCGKAKEAAIFGAPAGAGTYTNTVPVKPVCDACPPLSPSAPPSSTGGTNDFDSVYGVHIKPPVDPEIQVLRDVKGNVTQIEAPQAFATVTPLNDTRGGYRIDVFAKHFPIQSGVFTPVLSTDPVQVIEVRALAATTPEATSVSVTENPGNPTETVTIMTWDFSTGEWTKSKQRGAQSGAEYQILPYPLRSELGGGWNAGSMTNRVQEGQGITEYRYEPGPYGRQLVSKIADPDGLALATTYTYQNDPAQPGFGKVTQTLRSDGSWMRTSYDAQGRVITTWGPVGNQTPTDDISLCSATHYSFTPVDPRDTGAKNHSPRTTVEMRLGVEVGRSYNAFFSEAGLDVHLAETAATPGAPYGDPTGKRSTTRRHPGNTGNCLLENKTASTTDDRGFTTSYDYERGDYSASIDGSPGAFTPNPAGLSVRISAETKFNGARVPFQTNTRHTIEQFGNTVQQQTFLHVPGGESLVDWTTTRYNEFVKPVATYSSNGTSTSKSWLDCCNEEAVTAADGSKTVTLRDVDDRVTATIRKGILGGLPDLVSTNVLNAAGQILQSITMVGNLAVTNSVTTYDSAGRISTRADALGNVTSYFYDLASKTDTVVSPAGVTNVTVRLLDGRVDTVHEGGVLQSTQSYGINPDGSQWTQSFTGPLGLNSPAWTKTTTDFLGRSIRQEQPAYGGGVLATVTTYDADGRMASTQTFHKLNAASTPVSRRHPVHL